jgi:hypothetical protein
MQLQISQHAYEILMRQAHMRSTTPEALVESMAEELITPAVAEDETAFYHALGFNDAEIQEIHDEAKRLPDAPMGPPLTSFDLDEG